ncbi:MAG: pyridoxamine 5'-phosphate oxidase family protein [Pseudomonadota bacterium]
MTGSPEVPDRGDELRGLAQDLINSVSTMTLATSGPDSVWAAPVYYVYQEGRFFFFSKPESRHIGESLAAGFAAAAIHANAESWQHIRGLQMSGAICKSGIGLDAICAVQAYLRKFPFTKEFFKEDQQMDLKGFITRFKVSLYHFTPERVLYQDNQIRFGFREEISLEPD